MADALHTFSSSHALAVPKAGIMRASFAFFKFLFRPLDFVFTFGISSFVAFPYLDKLSIPQRIKGEYSGTLLNYSGGLQVHPDSFIHLL